MKALYGDAPDDLKAELRREIHRDPSLVSDDDLLALSEGAGVTLPGALLGYLKAGLSGGIERDEYCLPGVPADDPLGPIATYLFEGSLRPVGYLQFASGPCGDAVCFDIGTASHNDFRVVCFNHDLVSHDAWSRREALQAYAEEIAPSFAAFLERLCRTTGDP